MPMWPRWCSVPDPSTIGQTVKAWLATATHDYARATQRKREGAVSMAEVQLLEAYWELGAEFPIWRG